MPQPLQWQQDVNRHSQLADPVVTIQELSRFKPLRTTRIDYALVFTTAQGGLDTYLPPNRPSRTELATRRWSSVYEVDTGQHGFDAVLALPSRDDAFLFEVTLNCGWQVTGPGDFVASGVRDVPAMAQGLVDQLIRPVLRQYAMADSAIAEKAAQETLLANEPLGATAGLWLGCVIQIRQDEEALRHARELREIEFAQQKLDPRHALHVREDELAAERALAQGRHEHLLALQEQNLAHERELTRSRQELELREYEAKKIEYYAYYLERGGPQAMAMQLAQHPEDAQLIMANLREDQLRLMQNQFDVAMRALGGGPGGLEEHQLDGLRGLAASVTRELLSARFVSAPFGSGSAAVAGAPHPASADGETDPAPADAAAADAAPIADAVPAADGTHAAAAPVDGSGAEPAHAGPVFGYRVPTQPPAR
ncbi:PE-PGRS family protein [Kitasatospora acidiphila]|uniref:PE-PGRS family protein n=1 Tax=Kitasatospora acidiphila TaxID=2567942 RepID=A0A540W6F0_9ACTN|nr:PE-PGRS family protein [Kitasatospora acidiphila]TQF04606.1 PE-PGRS family protein [Kitasatospora acidiphila]